MVDCPECGKRINAQGLGGHLYIVHGKRAGSKKREDKLSELQKNFAEYNERINRLLDDLLEIMKNLFEVTDKVGAAVEKHGSRLDALEREYKTGLQDLRDKLLDRIGQSRPTE